MENKNMDVIRKFIYNKIQGENVPGISIDDDVELVENRVVTSLVLIQIITGIEDIIEKPLITDDVEIEDFSTVNNILKHVEKVMKGQKCLIKVKI